MALLEITIFFSIIVFLLYKWATAKYKIFRERGVAHDTPWPIFGNVGSKVLFQQKAFVVGIIEMYTKFKDSKVYGVYNLRQAMFFVTDLELIKRIGIKNFDHFPDQHTWVGIDSNSLLGRSLVSLKGQQWKEMRKTLTPTFTGSKIRLMYDLVHECSIEAINYIEHELATRNQPGQRSIDIEMKDFFTRFSNDVIASAAFGIKVNSFKHKNNEFYTIGKTVTKFSTLQTIKFLLFACIPQIMKALRLSVFYSKQEHYFGRIVLDAMKYRQKHNVVRPDMIQLLMEAKRQYQSEKAEKVNGGGGESAAGQQHAEFNDIDLLAQCMLFFYAGFEAVATCLCFTLYELIMNPEVQQQLYLEISAMHEKLHGQTPTSDVLLGLKYLDMVISESLRKWPPIFFMDRACTSDIKMYADNGELLADFRKGDEIFIPIMAIQRDPEYFSNPEMFDPLRFSDERKHEIKPFTYMPFGIGPRNCIGTRMALMEVKSIMYQLVLKFHIQRSDKTVTDMLNNLRGFHLEPKQLFWTKFVPRDTAH